MFKEVDYSFKEYVSEEEPDIKMIKKYTYYEKDGQKRVIAGIYPKIQKIELVERTLREIIYNVAFSLSRCKDKLYCCEVSISVKNKSIRFLEKVFEDTIRDNTEDIGDTRKYNALCRRYFKYVLTNELDKFDDYAFLTGWESEKTYISINSDGSWGERYLDNKIFSGFIFDKEKKLKCRIKRVQSELFDLSEDDVKSYTQQFSLLFKTIMCSKELLGIFAYTIHSILWYYCADGRGTWTPLEPRTPVCKYVFSICIYGKNIDDLKTISNIFSNIYYIDMEREKNSKASHSISATSLNNRFLMWRRWHSIPVIVTNKGYNLNRNSSIVKRLHQYRRNGALYFFPVYLNKSPIYADENEDFNINHVMGIFKTSEELQLLKDEISYLLLTFILYLSDISNYANSNDVEIKKDYNNIHRIYQNTINELINSDTFNRDEQMNFALLYSAIRGFCRFLESYMKIGNIAKRLEERAYTFFLNDMPTESVSIPDEKISSNDDSIEIIKNFNKYIKYLFDISEKDRPFLYYIDDEKSGLRETCYYLESNKFYKHFLDWNARHCYINVSELKLKRILKDYDLLIMRSNGGQYASERWHTSNGIRKKSSCLIIKKDKFNQLIENSKC